jgi:hypothetical protein
MRKSRTVSISLVSGLAGAALTAGCGSTWGQPQGWQTCVDRTHGTAVEERYCDDEQSSPHATGYVPHYNWYYYPRGYYWGAPGVGSPVPLGGTYGVKSFGAPIAHDGTSAGFGGSGHGGSAVRGGFGSTAAGHASGGA